MDEIFRRVVTWFAPILCFTMEEAWLSRFPESESVHLQTFFEVPAAWKNPALIEKWKRVRDLRRVVTGALELERAAKKIGSSLEAAPTLYVADEGDAEILRSIPFDEVDDHLRRRHCRRRCARRRLPLPDVKGVARVRQHAHGRQMRALLAGAAEVGNPQGSSRSLQPLRRGARSAPKHETSQTRPREWGLVAAAAALIADQGSKFCLLYGVGFAAYGARARPIPVLPFFNLVMVWNPGVSYGLFPASSVLGTALLVAGFPGGGGRTWLLAVGNDQSFPGDRAWAW